VAFEQGTQYPCGVVMEFTIRDIPTDHMHYTKWYVLAVGEIHGRKSNFEGLSQLETCRMNCVQEVV
jgi:hypothetical protein